MTPDDWGYISELCLYLRLTWMWSWNFAGPLGLLLPDRLVAVARAIKWEIRPLYLPSIALQFVADFIHQDRHLNGWNFGAYGVALFMYWLLSKTDRDDDDRWKRRKQRLAEKVEELGGKLVVVPQPQGT